MQSIHPVSPLHVGPSYAALALRGRRRATRPPRERTLIVTTLLAASTVSGCASLDPRADVARSANAVEQAVGVPAELMFSDPEVAAETTRALLADGLSAADATKVALLNSPLVRSAMLAVGVSRADFVQSTLFSNPTLFLSLRFPDGGGRPNVEFNLAQSIAELWIVPARSEAARRDLERTVLDSARVVSAVVLDVRRAYVRAVLAEEAATVAQVGEDNAHRFVMVAELRRKAGTGSDVDFNLARAQHLQARATHRLARATVIEAKADLCRLLGLGDDPHTLTLIEPIVAPDDWPASANRLLAIARQARLDLRTMDETIAAAEARARLERVRFLRSLDLGFAFELLERRSRGDRNLLAETFFDSLQSGALTAPNLAPRSSVATDTITGPTLSAELPLWDRNQAQIAKADRLLKQLRQHRDALLVDLAQDIHANLARATAAIENARLYRDELVPTAEKNVTLAQKAYRLGSTPFLSLLEAQRAYLSIRTGQIQALRAAAFAQIELERATGRPAATLRADQPDDPGDGPASSPAMEIAQ